MGRCVAGSQATTPRAMTLYADHLNAPDPRSALSAWVIRQRDGVEAGEYGVRELGTDEWKHLFVISAEGRVLLSTCSPPARSGEPREHAEDAAPAPGAA